MDQREYRDSLDAIKCSDDFRRKMEKKLSAAPEKNEEFGDSVSHVERVRTSVFKRYAAVAAAAVLICGSVGAVWYRVSKDKDMASGDALFGGEVQFPAKGEDLFKDIWWIAEPDLMSFEFRTSREENAKRVCVNGTDLRPLIDVILRSEWTEDSEFIYKDVYLVDTWCINDIGQIWTGSRSGDKVFRTDSATAEIMADLMYEAFMSSGSCLPNREINYKLARSIEKFDCVTANIRVTDLSKTGESPLTPTIDQPGHLRYGTSNGVVFEECEISDGKFIATCVSEGDTCKYSLNTSAVNMAEKSFDLYNEPENCPRLSYRALTERVFQSLDLMNQYVPEEMNKFTYVDSNENYYVWEDGEVTYTLRLHPDTHIITEYIEEIGSNTVFSYVLYDMEFLKGASSEDKPDTEADDKDNNTVQNIIRLNIPDGDTTIMYQGDLYEYMSYQRRIDVKASTAELKELLRSCHWEKSTDVFENANIYMFPSEGATVYINEAGQLKNDDHVFITHDNVDEINALLQGFVSCDRNTPEGFRLDLIRSASKYDRFRATGDITFRYYRHIVSSEGGIPTEEKCSYEIQSPDSVWDVSNEGQSLFSGNSAKGINSGEEIDMAVQCRREDVNITISECGKNIDRLDYVGELIQHEGGILERVMKYNLTGAPGVSTSLPDYRFMADRALDMMLQMKLEQNYQVSDENRTISATFLDGDMTSEWISDVTIGLDENGMLVRYIEKHDGVIFYDMTLDEITLDPEGNFIYDNFE